MNMGYLYLIHSCLNINVITLVVYATIETKLQTGKKPTKTPQKLLCQKPSKNFPKIFYDFLNKKPAKNLKQ